MRSLAALPFSWPWEVHCRSSGRQIREGHASDLSLVAGGACFAAGILLLVLADLGTTLVRIEMKLGTLPEDLPGTEPRRAVDHDLKTPPSADQYHGPKWRE